MAKSKKDPKLLGVGLDGQDGMLRLTRAKNFELVGGSQETHEKMQEQCIKFNEKLDARGKQLADLGKSELCDLAAECKMNLVLIERVRRPGQG